MSKQFTVHVEAISTDLHHDDVEAAGIYDVEVSDTAPEPIMESVVKDGFAERWGHSVPDDFEIRVEDEDGEIVEDEAVAQPYTNGHFVLGVSKREE